MENGRTAARIAMASLDDTTNETEVGTPIATAQGNRGRAAQCAITTPQDQQKRKHARSSFRNWIGDLHETENMPQGIRKRWGG